MTVLDENCYSYKLFVGRYFIPIIVFLDGINSHRNTHRHTYSYPSIGYKFREKTIFVFVSSIVWLSNDDMSVCALIFVNANRKAIL